MKTIFLNILFILSIVYSCAQTTYSVSGKVFDAVSKEPLAGALVSDSHHHVVVSDAQGRFSINSGDGMVSVSYAGFQTQQIKVANRADLAIALIPSNSLLQQVVVSASRTAQKRIEAPVAISTISKQIIDETRAQRLDQLLNKVSGVFMVNLGNEQHEMSIRQPMTTKSVYLYLEDGIPIRATGVYNHNALLEMNLPAAKSIEVIKGPSSALYGAEAVAGAVNVITQASPAFTSGSVSTQINNNGYKRVDLQAGTSFGKWGVIASGYYADRNNGRIDYSDFHKTAFTFRSDYKPNDKTSWTNTLTYINYYSDMTGTLDSLKFAQKNYSTPYTFTFRSVEALRIKSMLDHQWSKTGESSLSFLFRNNSVKQNPSYSVGTTADPLVYRGQINDNSFKTFALFAQHTQRISWLNSKLIAGASLDISPQDYYAKFIRIQKDAVSGKYISYTSPTPDSLLQNFNTGMTNLAGYLNYSFSPAKNFKIVVALRYDAFRYNFKNHLDTSKTTVALSTINNYSRFTPKLGLTYNYKGIGFYANYSEGYVPPQLTELYSSGSKVAPYLLPQIFRNYEVGGWISLWQNKWYADWSLYLMQGTNEIISVRQADNTYLNQNAGKTKHLGVEYGINYKPGEQWAFRISATNAKHSFIENVVRGINYNGKEMSAAPRFTGNAECTYKPKFVKGLRMGAEWQHQGVYYMDDLDQFPYPGFDVINLRAGYQIKAFDFWLNALNVFNQYYATLATKNATARGSSSYAYQLGDPREITVGVAYRFGK